MHVVLVQTAIADYRNAFVQSLVQRLGSSIEIMVGEKYFEESTKTSNYVLNLPTTKKVENFFFLNRKFCYQVLPIGKLISSDVVVFELNPRLLSNWLVLSVRKILGKKNVIWGHAWARKGSSSKTEPIRHLMRILGDSLIFYTSNQMEDFVGKYPAFKRQLFVAPNSLYTRDQIYALDGDRSDIIYVGRLVESKRVDLLIHGFRSAISSISSSCRLKIVGSGPELAQLRKLAEDIGVSDRIDFLGHISNVNDLRSLYSDSLFSVSPGYVGLSITQSFAFGVPMLVADNEPHSPEIEAFVDGRNGYFFPAGSVDGLAAGIVRFYNEFSKWRRSTPIIVEDCKERYSVENMAEGFINACK